ncbi:MAG: NAD(P)-dependent oxidoreductase [Gammaproteobacteria bacterium]|nr:MAG: NAD(P)-dependent oxidoreductase [Gammaproteobacteria bacterium]
METILITGANGYLGSHLVKSFLSKKYNVIGLEKNCACNSRIQNILPKEKIYFVEENGLDAVFGNEIDTIIHTATCYGRNLQSNSEVAETNLLFSIKLLEFSVKYKVKSFVNIGTSLPKFISCYSLSKRQFSEWGKMLSDIQDIQFIDAELSHFYGPNDDKHKFIAFLMGEMRKKNSKIDLTTGQQKRDFIYIDDLVACFVLIVDKIKSLNKYECIQIGTEEELSIKEIVLMLRGILKSDATLNFGARESRPLEPNRLVANTEKIRSLGWNPKYTLKAGLKKIIQCEGR